MRPLPIGLLAALVWEPGPVVAQATGDKGQIEGRVTAASDTSAAAAGAEI